MDPIILHSLYIGITFIAGTAFGILIKNKVTKLSRRILMQLANNKKPLANNEEIMA